MLQIKVDAKTIREFFNLILTLVQEARVDFKPDGISSKVMDPARVAMISLEIKRDAFQEFNIDGEDSLGLDIEKMRNFLRLTGPDEIIDIKFDGKRISMKVGNLAASIPMIDPSTLTTPKIPTIEPQDKIVTDLSLLLKGIKAAEGISEVVTFSMKNDEVRIFAKGETDSETTEMTVPKSQAKEYIYSADAKSSFALEYLTKFLRALESTDEISISLGNDYPLRMEAPILNGKGKVTFLIAPRIENI
ncbi:MAG: DNA polymerase sliding clamp [Thermoplasmatales archaeon]